MDSAMRYFELTDTPFDFMPDTNQPITEAFDSSYDFERQDRESFKFVTDDDSSVEVRFEFIPEEWVEEYKPNTHRNLIERYGSFPKIAEVYFTRDGTYDLTNKGDAFKIFSTVISIINTVVEDDGVEFFTFTGKEPKRYETYKKIAAFVTRGLNAEVVNTESDEFRMIRTLKAAYMRYGLIAIKFK